MLASSLKLRCPESSVDWRGFLQPPIDSLRLMPKICIEPSGDGPGASIGRELRILLVDDDDLNQDLAAAILKLDGFVADVARNGRQAVEAVSRVSYDLVLMDIQMPQLDGIQATGQIRALPSPNRDVWIIALSGSGKVCSQADCRAVGMDDYITKPYHPDVLREKVCRIAQQRPAHTR